MVSPEAFTELVPVRHAESIANVEPIIGGMRGTVDLRTWSCPSPRLGSSLWSEKPARAMPSISSTLPRALETASYLIPVLHQSIIEDDALQELRPGEADGLTHQDWLERYPRPQSVSGWDVFDPISPGFPHVPISARGETWTSFLPRATRALAQIVVRHPSQRVVLVTHGGNIRAALFLAFGLTATEGGGIRFDPLHTSLTALRYCGVGPHEGKWILDRYNDAYHIHDEPGSLA